MIDAGSVTFFIAHAFCAGTLIAAGIQTTFMNDKNDDRFEAKNEPRGSESRPASPTSSTADNPSVYQQPPIEKATQEGKTDKMDEHSEEDRKHTP